MIEITTTDDLKGKYQSCTANAALDKHLDNGSFSFLATAYGATEKEALDRLQEIIEEFKVDLHQP